MKLKEQSTIRLLIVDDEEDIRWFLREFFTMQGYQVRTAMSEADTLKTIEEFRPDLVLLDMCLTQRKPATSEGIAILKELKMRHVRTKVMVLTGIGDEDVLKQAIELGADGYLKKPISLEYLETVVAQKIWELFPSAFEKQVGLNTADPISKILIIDDEPDILIGFQGVLQNFKELCVFTTSNARQGVQLAKEEKPDLILLDLRMPGLGGEEALKELKPLLPKTKFIIITGWEDNGQTRDRIERELGVDAYFDKPFDLEKVVDKILQLVGRT